MPTTAHNLDELSNVAQIALLQALQALAGAEAAIQNDRIMVKLASLNRVQVRVLEVTDAEDSSVVQLAIQVVGDATGREGIFDILAGVESSPHEAILTAIRKWIRFTFPPIRAALSDAEQYDLNVGITQLVARPDLQWKVYTGNPLLIGQPQDTASLQAALREQSLFPGVAGDTVAARLNGEARRLHWIKLFAASANGEKIVECQFDNGEWPELDRLVASAFRFPPLLGDFLSVKQFVVVRPD